MRMKKHLLGGDMEKDKDKKKKSLSNHEFFSEH